MRRSMGKYFLLRYGERSTYRSDVIVNGRDKSVCGGL
jgi:hypothetical protein